MQDESCSKAFGPSTACVHSGAEVRVDGSVVFPIFQSATFLSSAPRVAETEAERALPTVTRYSRCNNNPTCMSLASRLAHLEGAETALVTSSGMAAVHATLTALLSAGDNLLVQESLYGGTQGLLGQVLSRQTVTVTHLPVHGHTSSLPDLTQDQDSSGVTHAATGAPSAWTAQVTPNTKVIYVETLSNPLVRVADLPALATFARDQGLVLVVDNTLASPVNCRPCALGPQVITIESATKYLNGHSDVVAGVVAGSAHLVGKVFHTLGLTGGCLDPHAAFLLERGIKTLALRVARQNGNALALATALEGHPEVVRVHYPGLPSHPDHHLAARVLQGRQQPSNNRALPVGTSLAAGTIQKGQSLQPQPQREDQLEQEQSSGGQHTQHQGGVPQEARWTSAFASAAPETRDHLPGCGGLLSFELRGGKAAADALLRALRVATVAPSLGGVETLVTLPCLTSHSGLTPEQRAAQGICDGMVRVACGIEDSSDLVQDFLQALATIHGCC